jgi:hypothetical protein
LEIYKRALTLGHLRPWELHSWAPTSRVFQGIAQYLMFRELYFDLWDICHAPRHTIVAHLELYELPHITRVVRSCQPHPWSASANNSDVSMSQVQEVHPLEVVCLIFQTLRRFEHLRNIEIIDTDISLQIYSPPPKKLVSLFDGVLRTDPPPLASQIERDCGTSRFWFRVPDMGIMTTRWRCWCRSYAAMLRD